MSELARLCKQINKDKQVNNLEPTSKIIETPAETYRRLFEKAWFLPLVGMARGKAALKSKQKPLTQLLSLLRMLSRIVFSVKSGEDMC